jgi:hypothetical protein
MSQFPLLQRGSKVTPTVESWEGDSLCAQQFEMPPQPVQSLRSIGMITLGTRNFSLSEMEIKSLRRRNSTRAFAQSVVLSNMYYLPYDKSLKEFSRELRKHSTLGEILLWQKLRARSMMNYMFNRQMPLDRHIVDFYCKRLNLVIEVDGSYHFETDQKIKDE